MKKVITPEQEKIIDTINNLVWHRITLDDKYFDAIPEINSRDFHFGIYYMKYEAYEYVGSMIQAIIYLNGKHYSYTQTAEFLNSIWVDEIDDTDVKQQIIEIGGEIYEGFELYNTDSTENASLVCDKDELGESEYYDLPF